MTPLGAVLPSGRMRAKSINTKRLSKAAIAAGRKAYPVEEHAAHQRPRTRAECPTGPCPWVSCAHHLYLDVSPETGSIKINHPDKEVWELAQTCALDVVDPSRSGTGGGDGVTLEEVGELLNLTRERVRQLETSALVQLRVAAPRALVEHRPCPEDAPRDPTPDPHRESKNLRALALAGWTRVRLDAPGRPEQWRDPEGRIVCRTTAIRTARVLLTVLL